MSSPAGPAMRSRSASGTPASRRRAEDVREHRPLRLLDDVTAAPAKRLGCELRELGRAVARGRAVLADEQLRADLVPGHHRQHDGATAGLDDATQLREKPHSSTSTKTSISPPHGSPTSSAMSSVIP